MTVGQIKLLLGGIGVLLLGIYIVHLKGEVSHWQKQAESCAVARALDQAAIKTKTAEAKAADTRNVIRVVTAQSKVNEEVSHDYETAIAAARRRAAERVRSQSGADPRGVGHSPDPAAGSSAGRVDGAAAEAGLSDPERLECTEIALRLHFLQEWELKQQAIPLDAPEKVLPPG